MQAGYVWLVIIGVLNSAISVFYYLRVMVIMYMRDGEPVVRREVWLFSTAMLTAISTVLLSIFAEPLFKWVSEAVLQLL